MKQINGKDVHFDMGDRVSHYNRSKVIPNHVAPYDHDLKALHRGLLSFSSGTETPAIFTDFLYPGDGRRE